MKYILRLFILGMVLSVATSCSKDDNFNPDKWYDALLDVGDGSDCTCCAAHKIRINGQTFRSNELPEDIMMILSSGDFIYPLTVTLRFKRDSRDCPSRFKFIQIEDMNFR
jgi:hypothetical protein